MKIALTGYGKMGHIIENIAKQRGHEVVCIIDKDNLADFDSEAFRSADCVIEFSTPGSAEGNIRKALAAGIPVVCGTTGWTDKLPEIKEICSNGDGTFLFASNFSVGVNIFMGINRYLARIMGNNPQYTPYMTETHHVHKLDHPSGTAITLARQIMEEDKLVSGWCEPDEAVREGDGSGKILEIEHERRGEVPGIHTIDWDSPVDTITISHSAKSREGFALGAVIAAEWLADKKGYHTIEEVFDYELF